MLSMEIKGLDELNRKLRDLSDAVHEETIEKALLAGAYIIEGYAKVNAPVDTGFLRNSIYSAIPGESNYDARVSEAQGVNRGAEALPSLTPERGTAIVAVAAAYGAAVEYRTKPYMRMAVDGHIREVGQAIAENLRDQLERRG